MTLYKSHYEDYYNGTIAKSLTEPVSYDLNYPQATIRKEDYCLEARAFTLYPLVSFFRGDNEKFLKEIPYYKIISTDSVVNNRTCVQLVNQEPSSPEKEILYLDPDRDFIPVRKILMTGTLPLWQVDVTYTPDPLFGWVPSSWDYQMRLGDGRLRDSGTSRITASQFNDAFKGGVKDLKFPEGTRVIDSTEESETQYIIKEDQEKGRVIATSRNPTCQDLQYADNKSSSLMKRMLALGGLFFVCVGFVWLILKRRQRSRARDVV